MKPKKILDSIKNMCGNYMNCTNCNFFDEDNGSCLFAGMPCHWDIEEIKGRIKK